MVTDAAFLEFVQNQFFELVCYRENSCPKFALVISINSPLSGVRWNSEEYQKIIIYWPVMMTTLNLEYR